MFVLVSKPFCTCRYSCNFVIVRLIIQIVCVISAKVRPWSLEEKEAVLNIYKRKITKLIFPREENSLECKNKAGENLERRI